MIAYVEQLAVVGEDVFQVGEGQERQRHLVVSDGRDGRGDCAGGESEVHVVVLVIGDETLLVLIHVGVHLLQNGLYFLGGGLQVDQVIVHFQFSEEVGDLAD